MPFLRIDKLFRTNQGLRWVIIASLFFVAVQWYYSSILWDTGGNLPPVTGDSYNNLLDIHKFAVGHRFLSVPDELYNGAFSYFYGLISLIFHLEPDTVYFLGFFFTKLVLLWALIYFFSSIPLPLKTMAILLLVLGVFSGSGEIHGFYWAVPSLWMLIIFLVLLGMAFRQIAWWFMAPIAFLLMNIHPIATYLVVIVIGMYGLLFLLRARLANLGQLIVVLSVMVLVNQLFIFGISRKKTLGVNQLNNVLEVSDALFTKVDPAGGGVSGQTKSELKPASAQVAPVQVIRWSDVWQRIKQSGDHNYSYSIIYLPRWLIQWLPALPVFWNAYSSFFFIVPYSFVLVIPLLLLFGYLAFQRLYWPLVSFFLACFFISIVTLSHPQGYRLILFLWPATLMVWGLGLAEGITNKQGLGGRTIRLPYYVVRALSIIVLIGTLALWLGYSEILLRRIAKAATGSWDRACVQEILEKSRRSEIIYYSGNELAFSAMIAYGLYERPQVEFMDWPNYISDQRPPKVFVLDRDLSRDPSLAAGQQKVRSAIDQIEKEFGLKRIERSCGIYTVYFEEKQ